MVQQVINFIKDWFRTKYRIEESVNGLGKKTYMVQVKKFGKWKNYKFLKHDFHSIHLYEVEIKFETLDIAKKVLEFFKQGNEEYKDHLICPIIFYPSCFEQFFLLEKISDEERLQDYIINNSDVFSLRYFFGEKNNYDKNGICLMDSYIRETKEEIKERIDEKLKSESEKEIKSVNYYNV